MIRIWKLTPTNLADPKKWSPEPIIVRAECEADARHLALLKTTDALPSISGLPIAVNPWGGYKKIGDPAPPPSVREDITGLTNEYSVNGPAEVLHHGEKW